jgi:hypothetical protein
LGQLQWLPQFLERFEVSMFLRVKIGRYAGEIREFPFTVARDLLASGRAENPFAEPAPAPAQPRKTRAAGPGKGGRK